MKVIEELWIETKPRYQTLAHSYVEARCHDKAIQEWRFHPLGLRVFIRRLIRENYLTGTNMGQMVILGIPVIEDSSLGIRQVKGLILRRKVDLQ